MRVAASLPTEAGDKQKSPALLPGFSGEVEAS
jgi:hypothetical protein